MKRVLPFLRGLYVWPLCYLGALFWAFLAMVTLPISPSGRMYMKVARMWAGWTLFFSRGRLKVTGGSRVDWSKPVIVVSNHVSTLDIPILFKAIPTDIRFMAKHVLARVPVFGWSMWAAGFIFVNRSNAEKSRQSIDAAADSVKKGKSVLIFPEGTRSDDGQLLPFKKGGFVLAVKTGVQVVPVYIHNSWSLLAKGDYIPAPATVEVRIGDAIDAGAFTMETRQELLERVRGDIEGLKASEFGDERLQATG